MNAVIASNQEPDIIIPPWMPLPRQHQGKVLLVDGRRYIADGSIWSYIDQQGKSLSGFLLGVDRRVWTWECAEDAKTQLWSW